MESKNYLKTIENRSDFLEKVQNDLKKRKNLIFPYQVIIETTANCNMKCIHCGHANMKRAKGNMNISVYKKIIDEIAIEAPETEVWLTYYGEALLLKYKLFYMIQYAKEKGLKYLILNTNGMLLDDEMSQLLIESGLDRLIFSLDGFSELVYDKIRVNGKRDIVYNNINNLINKMNKLQIKRPYIEIQFSVMNENEQELEEFLQYWSGKSVFIKIREKFTWCNTVDATNLDQNQNRIACAWPIAATGIFWNGDVNLCVQDYEGRVIIGNIKDTSIKETWNNQTRKDFIINHINNNFDILPDFCKKCMDWQAVGAESYEGKMKKTIDWKKIILGKEDDKAQFVKRENNKL